MPRVVDAMFEKLLALSALLLTPIFSSGPSEAQTSTVEDRPIRAEEDCRDTAAQEDREEGAATSHDEPDPGDQKQAIELIDASVILTEAIRGRSVPRSTYGRPWRAARAMLSVPARSQ